MRLLRRRSQLTDRGGARLAGSGNMIAALDRLKAAQHPLPAQFSAFGISSGSVAGGLRRLFMSQPPLEQRIAALRAAQPI